MTASPETAAAGTEPKSRGGTRVAVQKFGSFLSNMIIPNIGAFIAWGLITALFIETGWTPVPALGGFGEAPDGTPYTGLVGPMLNYLLPILIAYTGGRVVYEHRGGVVGAIATIGVIVGAGIPMFIGAMIMGPLGAWTMKKLDELWAEKIRPGFELLVNNFSAGIWGMILTIIGFLAVAPLVEAFSALLGRGVEFLVDNGLLPLTSVFIEPAKILFLNNAINHGILTPLAVAQAQETGDSVLFLLEANPGPGLGVLLAFSIFGRGMARGSAPGAAIIHFFGGIHEIYFPYVLMKPAMLLAVIGGGMTGVFLNVLFSTGLRAPAAPGSIIAIYLQAASDSYLGVTIAVLGAAAVSFAIAALLLKLSPDKGEGDLAGATANMESMKGKKSSVAGSLTGAGAASAHTGPIENIVFACDAGMGSSAMGASVLRKKVHGAGFRDVTVINQAISNLTDSYDLVVTHQDLTDRARQRTGSAVHVSVDNFMNSPRYDEIVDLVANRNSGGIDTATAEPATASASSGGATAASGSAEASESGTSAPARPAGGSDAAAAAAAGTANVVGAATGTAAQGTSGAGVDEDHTSTDTSTADRDAVAPAADAEPPANDAAGPAVLTEDTIVLDGTATGKEEAIEEAGRLLADVGAVEESYVDSMHEREKSVSTYMGNLLAIPHGTNEAKGAIRRSAISVVRFPGGIDWDGDEVKFVIGIAGANDEHMQLLTRIASVFADEDQVTQLEQAATKQEILDLLGKDDS